MAAEVAALFDQARAFLSGAERPVRLSDKEVAALTGEWYRQRLAEWEENPGSPHGWEDAGGNLVDALRDANRKERQRLGLPVADDPADDDDDMRVPWFSGRLSGILGWIEQDAIDLLAAHGHVADDGSRQRLAESLADNALSLFATAEARSRGDYSPDRTLESFPKVEPIGGPGTDGPQVESAAFRLHLGGEPEVAAPPAQSALALTFEAIREGYLREGSDGYDRVRGSKRYLDRLAAFLRHSDASRVTKADIVRWKEHLLKKGFKPKTINHHIKGVGAVFNHAFNNAKLASNPASGISVATNDDDDEGRLPFTKAEAINILVAARGLQGVDRWAPWLQAFSGARVEEICQRFASEVRCEEGIWYLDIKRDPSTGRRVKTESSKRRLPLHPALIAEGFIEYHKSIATNGPLFPDIAGPGAKGKWSAAYSQRARRWFRGDLGIKDKRKVVNHSWRHYFKDACRDAEIPEEVHDRLTGHAPQTVSRGYGQGHSLGTLAAAIARIPLPSGLTVPGYVNGATQAEMLAIPSEATPSGPSPRVRPVGKRGHAPRVAKRKLVPGKVKGRKSTGALPSPPNP